MDIQRVYGENFCQYPTLDLPLNPGLTCLLGLNGSGKSNMVRAVYLCLLGEVYGTPNLVRDGRAKGFVAMDIVTQLGKMTVRRELKHNPKTRGTKIKHVLEAEWLEQPLTKKADVAGFLLPLIGASANALEHVSFALQGQFDSLMLMDHIDRVKILNSLMNMKRAEDLRAVLKDGLDMIAHMPDRTEHIAMAKDSLVEATIAYSNAEAKLDLEGKQLTDAVKGAYTKALGVKDKSSSVVRDEELTKVRAKRALQSNTMTTKVTEEARLKGLLVEAELPDFTSANGHNQYLRDVQEAGKCREALETLQASPPHTLTDKVYEACSEAVVEQMRVDHTALSKLNDQITAYGTGVCVTCGQTLPGTFDVEQAKKDRDVQQAAYAEKHHQYEVTKLQVDDYNKRDAAHKASITGAETRLAQAYQAVDSAGPWSVFDMPAHLEKVAAHAKAAEIQKAHTAAVEALSTARHDLNKLDMDITRLVAEDVATPADLDWAEKMVTAYTAIEDKIAACKEAVSREKASMTSYENRIETLEKDMEQSAKNIEAVDLLEFARAQLHAEKLPRLAAQSSIAAINNRMLHYLDMFEFPYGFRLNEQCDFVVDYVTSKDHPAAILSGGERVRAAMATRFALMDVFNAGCGLLIIDEPTTALDSEARIALVEVLGTAAAHFRKRNIKILCPTHDKQLEGIADTADNLGE